MIIGGFSSFIFLRKNLQIFLNCQWLPAEDIFVGTIWRECDDRDDDANDDGAGQRNGRIPLRVTR